MDIKEFRKKYPQYDDMSDEDLAKSLWQKSYSDMPFKDFAGKFGVKFNPEDYPQLQPKPNAEVAKKIAGYALPIVGDIAGMYLMPEIKGPQLLARAANVGLRALGSGVGGFAGSVAGQKIEKGDVNLKEAGLQGAIGAGGELGMGPIGWAGKKLAKPLAQVASRITFSGQTVRKEVASSLIENTVKKANDFLYDVAPEFIKKKTVDIEDIALRMKNAKDEIGKIYDMYKAPVREAADKEGGLVLVDDTEQMLGEMMDKYREMYPNKNDGAIANLILKDEFGYSPNGPYGKELKRLMVNGEMPNTKTYFFLLDKVFKEKPARGSTFLNLSPNMQAQREALKNSLKTDMEAAAKAPKGKADQMFAEFMDFQDIKKIYDKALRDIGPGMQDLDPYKLATNIYMNKEKILKLDEKRLKMGLEPLWPKLEKEAKFYGDLVPYFQEAKKAVGGRGGSFGTAGSIAMGLMTGGGAYGLFGPVGIPVVEGFGAVSAWSLLSPTGKKAVQIAAKHILKPAAKASLHLGGELVDME